MYTPEQAKSKIESESFRLEQYIDEELESNFNGKELMISVKAFSEEIIWLVLDKYKKNGWVVRPQNINPGPGIGCVYFDLPK
jgi:hypothetical protein